MKPTILDFVMQLSDLYENTGFEGGMVSSLIDAEILPFVTTSLVEADGLGLGKRFTTIIDRVRQRVAKAGGGEDIRNLKDMMKVAIQNYVQKTHDTVTARDLFHHAIMSGADTMLTVTASVILANALVAHNPKQAQHLVQTVTSRLTGEQVQGVHENASGAATGAGVIATTLNRKKKRKDSIFAETLEWRDIQDEPETLALLASIAESGKNREIDGVMIDPTTAELVLVAHQSLEHPEQKQFRSKSLVEMIDTADDLIKTGRLQFIMEEV